MTLLPRWIKLGLMSASLSAAPMQNAFAFAPQWRPATPIAPIQPISPVLPLKPISPIAVSDQRFRPVSMMPQMAVQAPRLAPVAVRAVQPRIHSMPQPVVAPGFARQYAWRPATQRWLPRAQTNSQQPQYRLVRRVVQPAPRMIRPMPVGQGRWRPVQTITTPQGRFALRPVAVRGMFRPVPQSQYMSSATAAPQAYRPVARVMQVRSMRPNPFVMSSNYPQMMPYAAQPWTQAYPQAWRSQSMPPMSRQMPMTAAMPQYSGVNRMSFSSMPQMPRVKNATDGLPRWMSIQSPMLACGNCDS